MEGDNYYKVNSNEYSAKIRSKSSKVYRNNPYSKRRDSSSINTIKDNRNETKGLIHRVSDYIIPSWLSGWWSKDVSEQVSDDNYSDDDDNKDIPIKNLNTEHSTVKKVSLNEINHNSVPDLIASSSGIQQRLGPDLFKNSIAGSTEHKLKTTADLKSNIFTSASKERTPFSSSTMSKFNPQSNEKREARKDSDNVFESPQKIINTSISSSQKKYYRKRDSPSKPSFKVSAFVHPNTTYQTDISLATSSFDFSTANKSSFYGGQTVYGGSSSLRERPAEKRQRMSPVSNKLRTTRTQIKAKPLKISKQKTVTSDTAKKILNTLDKVSLPLQNQSKLPVFKSYKPSLSSQLRKTSTFGRSVKKAEPPVSKESKNTSFINDKSFFMQGKVEQQDDGSDSNMLCELPSFLAKPKIDKSFDTEISTKSSLKIKSQKHSLHYSSQLVNNDDLIANTLPEISQSKISLPLNTLPKFNFSNNLKPGFTSSPAFTPIAKINDIVKKAEKEKDVAYSFAKPSIKAEKVSSYQNTDKKFSFSNPAPIESINSKETVSNYNSNVLKNNALDSKFDNAKNNKAEDTNNVKENKRKVEFKQFSKPIGQRPLNSWNCPVCMIDNKDRDEKCVACNESKPLKQESIKSERTFAMKTFSKPIGQPASDTWSCPTCMINNKNSDANCIACNEKNPNVTLPSKDEKKNLVSDNNKLKLKFMNSNNDTWECPTCMISNKNDIIECPACSTSKPGSALTTSETKNEKPAFSFGLPKKNAGNSTSNGFSFGSSTSNNNGFTFGGSTNKDSGLTFGSTTSKKSGFTFGSSLTKDASSSKSGFSFGTNLKENARFSFANPSNENQIKPKSFGNTDTQSVLSGSDKNIEKPFTFKTPSSLSEENSEKKEFTFGNTTTDKDKSDDKLTSFSNQANKFDSSSNESKNTFSFGVTAPKINNVGFSFGVPTKEKEKDNTAGFSFGMKSDMKFGQVAEVNDTGIVKPSFNFTNPSSSSLFAIPKKVEESTSNDNNETKLPYKSIEEAAAAGFLKVSSNSNNSSAPLPKDSTTNIMSNQIDNSIPNNFKQSTNIFSNATSANIFQNAIQNTTEKNAAVNDKTDIFGQANEIKPPAFNFGTNSSDVKPLFNIDSKPLFQFSVENNAANKTNQPLATQPPPSFNFGSSASNPPNNAFNPNATAGFNFGTNNNLFSKPAAPSSSEFNFTGTTNPPSFLSGQSKPSFLTNAKPSANVPPQPSFLSESKPVEFNFTGGSLSNGQVQNNPFNPAGNFLQSTNQPNNTANTNTASRLKLKAARRRTALRKK